MKEKATGVHVWLVLWKAFKAFESYDRRSIAALDLCLSDFAVMEVLLHKGEMPVNQIGRKVLLTSGSITTAIDRLEERQFVRRQISADDARITLVSLTPKGRAFITQAFDAHQARMGRATSALTERERETLVGLLKKLGKGVEALNDTP